MEFWVSVGFRRSCASLHLWGGSPDCSSLVCQGILSEFCLDSETNRAKKRSILMCKSFVGQQGAAETGCMIQHDDFTQIQKLLL